MKGRPTDCTVSVYAFVAVWPLTQVATRKTNIVSVAVPAVAGLPKMQPAFDLPEAHRLTHGSSETRKTESRL